MRRPLVVVMVKEPRPGRVKTRLARDIGAIDAARWYRRTTLSLLRRIADPRWSVALAVSPDRDGLASRVWPRHLPRVRQGPGNLGDRMARLLRSLGPRPVLIVGSDIPGIDRAAVASALACLGPADAVFGPAPDGGYWAIGLARGARLPARALDGVRWSSPDALTDSRTSLAPLRIALADTLADVDTGSDLARHSG